MTDKTPNHGLNLYEQGTENWTHAPDMEAIEERLVVPGPAADRSDYTPHDGALYFATDTSTWYVGDGADWKTTAVGGPAWDHFASDDAELNDVLSESDRGDTIRLGNADFTEDRTIEDPYTFIGTQGIYIGSDGTRIDGATWTIDHASTLNNIYIRDSLIESRSSRSVVVNCGLAQGSELEFSGNDWLASNIISIDSSDRISVTSESNNGVVGVRSASLTVDDRGTDTTVMPLGADGSGGSGGTVAGRPEVSTRGREFRIPSDYDTLQDAIDETLPLVLKHGYWYVLEDGYYEDEPVFIPELLTGIRTTNYDGSSDFDNGDIRIRAETTHRPGGDSGLSAGLVVAGVHGASGLRLDSIDITGNINDGDSTGSIWRRDVGVLTFTANEISLYDVDFSGSGGYACVEPRSSVVNLEGCHVGDRDWEKGIYQKRGVHAKVDGITGRTTSEVLEARYGTIFVRNFDADGGAGDFDRSMGMIFHRRNGSVDLYGPTNFPDA